MDRRVRWVAVGVGLLVVARMAGWRRPAAARVLRVRVRPAEEPPDGETGAREHCALDPRTVGRVGGLGGQVLVRRDGVAGAYALFTVTDDYAARASAR